VGAHTKRESYETGLDQGYTPPDVKVQWTAQAVDGVDAPMDLVVLTA
jgi:hypothetical protein